MLYAFVYFGIGQGVTINQILSISIMSHHIRTVKIQATASSPTVLRIQQGYSLVLPICGTLAFPIPKDLANIMIAKSVKSVDFADFDADFVDLWISMQILQILMWIYRL